MFILSTRYDAEMCHAAPALIKTKPSSTFVLYLVVIFLIAVSFISTTVSVIPFLL